MSETLSVFEKEVLLCLEEAGETNFPTLLSEASARHRRLDFDALLEKMFAAVQSLLEKDYVALRSASPVSKKYSEKQGVLLSHMTIDELSDHWQYALVFRDENRVHFVSLSGRDPKTERIARIANAFRAIGETGAATFELNDGGMRIADSLGIGGHFDIVVQDKGWNYIRQNLDPSG